MSIVLTVVLQLNHKVSKGYLVNPDFVILMIALVVFPFVAKAAWKFGKSL